MIGRKSTTVRLSLGLVSLTISLLLAAELIGLLPNNTEAKLAVRTKIVELIAVQVSSEAENNNIRMVQTILTALVERDNTILSAALRRKSGEVLVAAGNHEEYWEPPEDGHSTQTHVLVPILKDENRWGVVELSFKPLNSLTNLAAVKDSPLALLAFISLTGFFFYFMFLRRTLRELDPSSVIPEHVKAAFDALAEGVIIMDEDEQIVLANKAFGTLIGLNAGELTGYKATDLDWLRSQTDEDSLLFPWQLAMQEGSVQTGVTLRRQADNEIRIYVVNGAPILDANGKTRGALATFDDISEMEKKNEELQHTLKRLANSKDEVYRQNKELRFLATRDPLTGLLNRRALFGRFEKMLDESRREGKALSAIMIDIDHFKSINDRYGHGAGDKVIKFIGKRLMATSEAGDIAARYGGEEFSLVLPGKDLEAATALADQLRQNISEGFQENFSSSIDLTISLGVSTLEEGVDSAAMLLNRADKALYAAKTTGRNRVIRWGDSETLGTDQEDGDELRMEDTMLIQKFEDTQVLQMSALSDRVMEMDAMIEEKSAELHQKHGFDELTGLPNRILFYDRVTQALTSAQREGDIVAILYLDIELLEQLDDLLEPIKGDEHLKLATDRLSTVLNSSETLELLGDGSESISVSRLADNEFGIALIDLKSLESITWIIQRLFGCLSKPFDLNGKEIYANTSIGISLCPGDGDDVATLVRCASMARHHAHADLSHNQFRFYADSMNERSFQQMRMQNQLREAIDRDEFVLYYQPEIDGQSGQCVALEALIRWEHPEMGLIGPDMFIQSAENSGLINEIGDWVLRTACSQLKEWLDADIDRVRVAVNLSPVQLKSKNFVKNILGVLKSVGLPPEFLELEITETALIDNIGDADKAIQRLRKAGVYIAIDDFGTGFSSLSHLKRLVVDSLKIDRSFISDVTTDATDAALVGAIIAMAHAMNLRVVAEGVETEAQLQYLRSLKCDVLQGYLLSHPISAAEMESLLVNRTGLFPALIPPESSDTVTAKILHKDFPKRSRAPTVTDVVASGLEKA